MILVIDNYDSFVHNLARYIRLLGYQTQIVRNNVMTIAEIAALSPSHIVMSPGPGAPHQAGICLQATSAFAGKIPILGICLGHQVIAEYCGAKVIRSPSPTHGKASLISHNNSALFTGCPTQFKVGRYHSLIMSSEIIPPDLTVTAKLDDGTIMAIHHEKLNLTGMQFHPESVLTEHGPLLLENYFSRC